MKKRAFSLGVIFHPRNAAPIGAVPDNAVRTKQAVQIIRKLCELLSINPAFSLAAGDAENDISMITEAGMGIAMTNATEAVKKAATTITLYDNDHDGLARTIIDMI